MPGECLCMFLGFNVYNSQVKDFSNVKSILDAVKGFDIACEKKKGLYLKKDLCDTENINKTRLMAIKLMKKNRINSFSA